MTADSSRVQLAQRLGPDDTVSQRERVRVVAIGEAIVAFIPACKVFRGQDKEAGDHAVFIYCRQRFGSLAPKLQQVGDT